MNFDYISWERRKLNEKIRSALPKWIEKAQVVLGVCLPLGFLLILFSLPAWRSSPGRHDLREGKGSLGIHNRMHASNSSAKSQDGLILHGQWSWRSFTYTSRETREWYLPKETLTFWVCLDASQILLAKEKASCEVA